MDNNNVELNELVDDPQQIFNQLDHRGFNLLLIAAENGNSNEIERLLGLGFDVNSSIGPHTAASLAYTRQHYDSLLILLNANSKFPPDFDAESTQHADLITFEALISQFHEHLFSEEIRELQTIITAHPHLRYFFNVNGHSAAYESLDNMIVSCYELFVQNNILISPDEDVHEAIASLTPEQKDEVRVIHERHAVPLPDNHLMIIHGSLFVGHDINQADRAERLRIARNAINFLNDIQQIQPILKLIARAGCFKIIFDFNRESTQFLNPKSSRETRGIFCSTRHVYIAARNLLNDINRMEVYGTMAHELTHFAMDLVYDNNCKPYKLDDRDTIGREFHQILLRSRQQRGVEEIVDLVWRYPDESQLAELIVRIPHMMAFYGNNQVILDQRQIEFQQLFNFYATRVVPDIESKIPTINAEVNQRRADFYDQTLKKVSRWRKTAKVALGFTPIGIFIAALVTYYTVFMPDISYAELSSEDQLKVLNGNVKFLNVSLNFQDLYNSTNSQLLSKLDSIQLRTLMNGETLDLNNELNEHLQDQIFLVYSNMTDDLRHKLIEDNINFQGQQLRVKEIIGESENSKVLEALNVDQIRKLFFDSLNIGRIQEIETKFYIERDFIDFNININSGWDRELNKMVWSKEVLENSISFDQICSIADDKKIILLSDHAGTGKTTTFKHFTVEFKKRFPHFWISYIDLKRHWEVYEKNKQDFQVLPVLKQILDINNDFDAELFTKLFSIDRVILLYDGVDEIAPQYKNFFIKFIESVRKVSTNQQWVATRPQHMRELEKIFNQKAYKLLPYDDNQKIELIENVLKNLNLKIAHSKSILGFIYRIAPVKTNIDSPLMLQMMTELYVNDKTSSLENSNFFILYDKMIEMKKDIVAKEKGDIVNKDHDNTKAKLTIWQVHQIYALKLVYNDGFQDCFNDDKMINISEYQLLKRWKKEKQKWTPEAISRYGFLYVDNWNTNDEFPDFVHRTFAEYFIVRFTIQDLYELDEDDVEMSKEEIVLRAKLLFEIFLNFETERFIFDFIRNHKSKEMHKIFFEFITSNEMQEFFIENRAIRLSLVRFFIIDERFLKKFRFNKTMTIFQFFFINEVYLSNIAYIIDIYKESYGIDWNHHTGYSLKENNSVSNNEETVKQNALEYKNSNVLHIHQEELLEFLNLINQLEIPQNDILKFFAKNFDYILVETLRNDFLAQKLMKFIENQFHSYKNDFLSTITKKINFHLQFEDLSIDIIKEFIHKFEEFLRTNDTVSDDDIKIAIVKLNLCFYGMKSLIVSYEEKIFTKSEIQHVFIKHSVEIIEYVIRNYDESIIEFITCFKFFFTDQSERNQLKKFLQTRNENEDNVLTINQNVLSYLDNEIKHDIYDSEKIKKLKLFQKGFIELAKQVDITDDEDEKLSQI